MKATAEGEAGCSGGDELRGVSMVVMVEMSSMFLMLWIDSDVRMLDRRLPRHIIRHRDHAMIVLLVATHIPSSLCKQLQSMLEGPARGHRQSGL